MNGNNVDIKNMVEFHKAVKNCSGLCGQCEVMEEYGTDCDNDDYNSWVEFNLEEYDR